MNKSRIFQLVILIAVFAAGMVFWGNSSSSTDTAASTTGEGYVPPSP